MDKIKADKVGAVPNDRAPWERPVLRRLEASKAGGSGTNVDDGHCVGTGAINLHKCVS